MKEFKHLMNLYQTVAIKAGFKSDREFMNAWASNPVYWNPIFNLRMKALSIMPSVC